MRRASRSEPREYAEQDNETLDHLLSIVDERHHYGVRRESLQALMTRHFAPQPLESPIARIITVNDTMQSGYRYELTAPEGRDFDPEFKPELTPKAMLDLGIFCGKYMTDGRDEFPADWFAHARLATGRRDCSLNHFGIDASQPLSEWRRKGWIHPDDPRGWFQWYCRYWRGRRMPEEDHRQIKRWKAMRRHIRQIELNCERGDIFCRCRQRQALLHWAYDSRAI